MGQHTYTDSRIKKEIQDAVAGILTDNSYAGLNGRYYVPFQTGIATLTNASTLSANFLQAIPFRITRRSRVTEAATYVAGLGALGAGRFRFGMYASDPLDLRPTNLLWQSPEINLTAPGVVCQVTGFTLDLMPGLYYFAVHSSYTTGLTLRGIPASAQQALLGYLGVNATLPISRVEITTQAYSASGLPAVFPGSPNYNAGAGFTAPALFIRSTPV